MQRPGRQRGAGQPDQQHELERDRRRLPLARVIPDNVSIRRQISCIHKTPRDNPWDDIEIIGGTDVTRGVPFTVAQDQAILEIDRGNTFFVVGADGSEAEVRVYLRF